MTVTFPDVAVAAAATLVIVAERPLTVTTALAVSDATSVGYTADGSAVADATTVRVSAPATVPDTKVPVSVAVAVSPVRTDAVAEEIDSVSACVAACEGATDRTPRPKAATATSATRLIVVDMCFLSIVDPRTIRRSA